MTTTTSTINYATCTDDSLTLLEAHAKEASVRDCARREIERRSAAHTHDSLLLGIARRHLVHGLSSFAESAPDSANFHEVAVWGIRDALRAAYLAGHQVALGQPTEALDQFPPAKVSIAKVTKR
jgi:hypothetical protein